MGEIASVVNADHVWVNVIFSYRNWEVIPKVVPVSFYSRQSRMIISDVYLILVTVPPDREHVVFWVS